MELFNIIKVVILGASSYHELFDLIEDINYSSKQKIKVLGLLDDDENLHGKEINGVKVLGPLRNHIKFDIETKFIFGIGSHKNHVTRRLILKNLKIDTNRFISLIHPTVKVFKSSKVEPGCIIHFGTIIFNNTIVKSFTIIMAMSVIGARNLIGEGTIITSKVSTTNGVKIGNYSYIGTGSLIGEFVEVMPCTKVSLGSIIQKNSSPGDFIFSRTSKSMKYMEVGFDIINDWLEVKNNFHF